MEQMVPRARPQTAFDWSLYREATLAGLSVLIPIPFVDSAFEWFFRRRMLRAIARRRGRRLDPAVAALLEADERGWLGSCLLLPVTLAWEALKRISAKVLYFLTIKEASDRLSLYWHRAFLLDYALEQGHLDDAATALRARQALQRTLATATTSPLEQLAQQLSPHTRHIVRALRRARLGEEDEVIAGKRSAMARAWATFGDYLADLAVRYARNYAEAGAQADVPGPVQRSDVGSQASESDVWTSDV